MFRIGLSDMTLILICHQEVQRASRLSIPDYESSVFSTKKTFKSFNSQHSIPNIRYIGINLFVMESYLWTQYHFFSCSSLNFRSREKTGTPITRFTSVAAQANFQIVTTILPFCWLDSMYWWALTISSSGKVRSMIGFSAPDWRPS